MNNIGSHYTILLIKPTSRNMKKIRINKKGFIKTIVLIIVALALAKFVFDFDILEFIKTPKVQETLNYVWQIVVIVWQDYIVRPVIYVWDFVKGFVD